jgi:hypothetical protein
VSLLPIYYNTNRLTPKRKRKKLSVKENRLREEHEKWIRKRIRKKSEGAVILATEKTDSKVESKERDIMEYDWSPCYKYTKPILTSSYVIGQAYNKGNLVVLNKNETTGKRR